MTDRAFITPRPAWRGVALLTVVIALAHLLALGLAPAGPQDHAATPLGGRFSTRTIVLAPPADPVAAAAPALPAPAAKPTPRPQRKTQPQPKALPPAPLPAPSAEPATPPPLTSTSTSTFEPTMPAPSSSPPSAGSTPDAAGVSDTASASAAPARTAADALASAAPVGDASAGPNEHIGTSARAMKIPGSTQLGFSVSGQQGTTPYQGGYGVLDWLQNGTDYDAQLTLKLLFFTLLNQHSSGHIGNQGLAPDRFADKRRNRTELAAHFVRDTSRIVFSNNKPDVPLQPGAQDRLSVMVQLSALLAGDIGRYPPGSTITVQTVGTSDGDVWTFNIEGDETLDLPAGTYQARKLSRNPRQEFDDKVELWLAPILGYLPVRLRFTQSKGDFFDIQLRSVGQARSN